MMIRLQRPGEAAVVVNPEDVVLTYRSQVHMKNGRVLRSLSDGFLGPMDDAFIVMAAGRGRWMAALTADGYEYDGIAEDDPKCVGPPRRPRAEWLSTDDIDYVEIVGEWAEWPLAIAEGLTEPPRRASDEAD
jgi:hypothetical protein